MALEIPGAYLHSASYNTHNIEPTLHCKKRLAIFPSPAGISLTKLSLAWNNLITWTNLIISGKGEFG
jgi:hypothetical protein